MVWIITVAEEEEEEEEEEEDTHLAMIASHSVAEVTEAPMAGPLTAAMQQSVTFLQRRKSIMRT